MVCVLAFAMDADAVNENIFNFTNCIPIRSLFFWRALIKKNPYWIIFFFKQQVVDILTWENVKDEPRGFYFNGFVRWLIIILSSVY